MVMKMKRFVSPIEFKADGEEGEFRAVFSRLNVIDHDGEVTLPGAFEDGQAVRVSYWGHRWRDLPVGRGVIHADEEKAWVDGRFFLDTEGGKETYLTVRAWASCRNGPTALTSGKAARGNLRTKTWCSSKS